jgi:asparagine synthase (glutamine-hydrolysing)
LSGIAGAWNLDGEPLDEGLLARIGGRLAHRGSDGEARRIVGSLGLVQQHSWITPEEHGERLPLASPSGVLLVMDGRIDSRDELVPELGLPPSASDAACVISSYAAWGERFVEHLTGDFAIALFDQPARRLLLVRDAIGARPLYYFRDDRLFAFASEIKALLAHPRIPVEPDTEGLADYLIQNSRPINRQDITCFRDVSALIPAHLLVVTPERVLCRRYWDFDPGLTVTLGSFDEYAEAYQEHFGRAVKRRVRSTGPVVVSISGGFDSSSIFCESEHLRRTGAARCPGVRAISYLGAEGTDADERRYLIGIEQQYGIEIERFPMEPYIGLVDGADEQTRASEAPFLDFMWSVQRELYLQASAHGRTFLSGHWGDQVLFSSAYLVDLFRKGSWFAVRRHLKEYDSWLDRGSNRVLAQRFLVDAGRWVLPAALLPTLKRLRRRLAGPARADRWFSDAFRDQSMRLADQPVLRADGFHSAHAWSVYLEARSKYHVHCLEWNTKIAASFGLTAVFPFLDRDLVQFLMAVPGEVQNRNGVPRALAREGMRGILPNEVRARTWKANFTDFVNSGVVRDSAWVKQTLSPDARCVRLGLVDADRLQAELQRTLGDGAGPLDVDSWDVGDLFGLEMWCQIFMAEAAV